MIASDPWARPLPLLHLLLDSPLQLVNLLVSQSFQSALGEERRGAVVAALAHPLPTNDGRSFGEDLFRGSFLRHRRLLQGIAGRHKQFFERATEDRSHGLEHVQTRPPPALLDRDDVRPVDAHALGQFILREPTPLSQLANPGTERPLAVHVAERNRPRQNWVLTGWNGGVTICHIEGGDGRMPSKNTLAVVLSPELLRVVRETAERETITISAVIRRALKSYFFGIEVTKRHDGGVSQSKNENEAEESARA